MPQHKSILTLSEAAPVINERVFYLTKVTYNESKHEVLVEFSNSNSKFVERHRFFPFLYFSSSIEVEKLTELVLSLGFRGFSVDEENDLIKIRALSFSELKKISTALALHINKKPLVLEPERNFLLEKNWSYFDAFEKLDDSLYKVSHALERALVVQKGWSGCDLGFFLTKAIPFSQALKVSEEDALFLVEQSAWSNLLKVPLSQIPKSSGERAELFLENVFFKYGEMLSFESAEKVSFEKDYDPFSRDATSKIDFSLVWAELFSNNFFNIGPETKNCSCCSPVTLDAKNLLPSSLIRVRFLEDNTFFESSSSSFASEFHNSNTFKDVRLAKRREYCLNSFPIGPFFKNDSVLVPIMDAKRMIGEGKAELVSSKSADPVQFTNSNSAGELHDIKWFCLSKESFFSKEVRAANSDMFELGELVNSFENSLFQKTFAYFYSKSLFSSLNALLVQLPSQLTDSSSKFFSTSLAKSIISVQEATIAKFKEFSENNGYRVLHAGTNFASVKGFSSLKLAKDFSAQTKLPQPQIAGFSSKQKQKYFR